MKLLHVIDRASGVLVNQLLSSTTSGSFDVDDLATLLGTQDWDTPTGQQAVLTIEDEQILVTLAESGGTLTATIVTRGYNSTTAATHAADSDVYVRLTSKHYGLLRDELNLHAGGLISIDVAPTITNATTLSVAGVDVTAIFTVGRVVLIKISTTWHRCVVRSSAFSTNTTINVTSDTLPASGTVADCAISMSGADVALPVDFVLLKHASAVPASNPPSGYSWFFTKGGEWWSIDSSGNRRFLGKVVASVSSSSGTLVLDGAVANVWEITLTENVTTITMQNGVDGQAYILRVTQHASAAKTVAVPAAWRFGTSITTWVMTTTVDKTDYIGLIYNGAASKWDVVSVAPAF